jgi:hypothetical protein
MFFLVQPYCISCIKQVIKTENFAKQGKYELIVLKYKE